MNFIKQLKVKKLVFPFLGLAALIWFLVRVIPKPSRVSYPCMRATAPLASSFILYLMGITGSMFIFKKAKERFRQSKYILTIVFIFVGLVVGMTVTIKYSIPAKANLVSKLEDPNTPMGIGKGIIPGRVAWLYDPDATNENMTNTDGDYWFDDKNTNQSVVNQMYSDGLKLITKATTDAAAWDSIFHFYNRTHGRGDVGYTAGEKIVIKVNYNAGGGGPGINTSPQINYALLDQLINNAGVAQADIGIGDPHSGTPVENYNKCNAAFPKVNYWNSLDTAITEPLVTSDGQLTIHLPQVYIDATYMINMPVLKKHHRAGISLCSKNHNGSVCPALGTAFPVHYSLPCPDADGVASNGAYGSYRIFVDYMGHKDLGGKTILYVIDGLWSSVNYAHPPIKWRMSPFNNDYPNSIFMSQDPVAIESVGFDFLFKEFDASNPTEGGTPTGEKGPFPHFPGVDDFLHQAADPANWPKNFTYNPNGDGVALKSMGVHEHWNNAVDKKYSRNLGLDKGIELVSNAPVVGVKNIQIAGMDAEFKNMPNPFRSSTNVQFVLKKSSNVKLVIYDTNGRQIRTLLNENRFAGTHNIIWDGKNGNGQSLRAGFYLGQLVSSNNEGTSTIVIKILHCD